MAVLARESSSGVQARRTTAWCATAVVLAAGADALSIAWRPFGLRVSWLEWAALGCLGAALALPGTLRASERWRTALDSRVLCALLLAATQLLPAPPGSEHAFTLRQAFACAAIYFGLVTQVRTGGAGVERLWDAIGLASAMASAHVAVAVTGGLAALRESLAAADRSWDSQAGLFKCLLVMAVLCTGRALERESGRGWRLLAALSTLAAVLAGVAGGMGLQSGALGRLDDPLHFSGVAVLLLLLAELVRRAWDLRRERAGEASRWRGAGLAAATLAVVAVFGGASGGGGVRALGTLLAVVLLLASETAAGAGGEGPGEEAGNPEEAPPLQRAA